MGDGAGRRAEGLQLFIMELETSGEMPRAGDREGLEGGGQVNSLPEAGLRLVWAALISVALTAGIGLVIALVGLYALHSFPTAVVGASMILASGAALSVGALVCVTVWLGLR